MTSAVSLFRNAVTSQVPTAKTAEASPTGEGTSTDFTDFLKAALIPDGANNVSEEELFAATIGERVSSLKGSDAATRYNEILASQRTSLTKPDGYVPHEQAAVNSLKQLVSDGTLTSAEADKIYSESFAASQLDNNADTLFDGRGGANDPTIAVASLEDAVKKAEELILKMASGELVADSRSLSTASATGSKSAVSAVTTGSLVSSTGSETITPTGTYVDGQEGFLFKPITNNQGKLAVLLGQEWTGNVLSVILKDQNDNVIEEGQLMADGIVETGREKYNFSKPGGSYQDNIKVEVTLSDGTVKTYEISDPSKRYD